MEAADSGIGEHLRALIETMEQTVAAHAGAYERDPTQAGRSTVIQAVTLLGAAYSVPERLTVKATIDQTVKVPDGQKAFLIVRSAEWALEAITLRKRTGDVTLSLTNVGRRRFAARPRAHRRSEIAGDAHPEGNRRGERPSAGRRRTSGHVRPG